MENLTVSCVHSSPQCAECTAHVASAQKTYSKEPCRKCGAFKVTVDDVDVSGGIDYVIDCEACGDHYRVDGPDA